MGQILHDDEEVHVEPAGDRLVRERVFDGQRNAAREESGFAEEVPVAEMDKAMGRVARLREDRGWPRTGPVGEAESGPTVVPSSRPITVTPWTWAPG